VYGDDAVEAADFKYLANGGLQRTQRQRRTGTLRSARSLQEYAQTGARDVVERGAIDEHSRWRLLRTGEHGFQLQVKTRRGAEIKPALRMHQRSPVQRFNPDFQRASQASAASVMSSDCAAVPAKLVTLSQMRSTMNSALALPCA